MSIMELLKKYNFHDSNVISIIHKESELVIEIELCQWKQKYYREGDKELVNKKIKFKYIKNYQWDAEKNEDELDYDNILKFDYSMEIDLYKIEIVLQDDGYISVITFIGGEVELI